MKYVKLLVEGKLKKARCFILYIHAWVVVALPFQPRTKFVLALVPSFQDMLSYIDCTEKTSLRKVASKTRLVLRII